MTIINQLGYTEYLNCFLVSNNIRPAYLLQFIDYKETSYQDPITQFKLDLIRRNFPNLKLTHFNQGTIISLSFYDIDELNTNKNDILSSILDYQCYYTPNNKYVSYGYTIYATINDDKKIPLFSYICCNSHDCDFKIIELIDTYNYKLKLIKDNNIIKSIYFTKNAYYNEDYYINLLKDNKIQYKDYEHIDNFLYNIGFSDKLNGFDSFDYSNPLHRGILIGLLTYSKYPSIEPFCPLQEHPQYMKKVDKQIMNWENTIINTLTNSK